MILVLVLECRTSTECFSTSTKYTEYATLYTRSPHRHQPIAFGHTAGCWPSLTLLIGARQQFTSCGMMSLMLWDSSNPSLLDREDCERHWSLTHHNLTT